MPLVPADIEMDDGDVDEEIRLAVLAETTRMQEKADRDVAAAVAGERGRISARLRSLAREELDRQSDETLLATGGQRSEVSTLIHRTIGSHLVSVADAIDAGE